VQRSCKNDTAGHGSWCRRLVLYATVGGVVAALALFGRSASAQPEPDPPSRITLPEVVTRKDAVYPREAASTMNGVTVVLLVTVDAEGHVRDVEVENSGGEAFDTAAITAARDWMFVPAKRDGQPVVARIRVPFRFVPPEEQPAPPPSPPTAAAPPPAAKAASRAEAAQGTNSKPAKKDDVESVSPTDVTVVGDAYLPSRGASDYDIRLGELKHIPRRDAANLLRLAPGVMLTNEGGTGHPYQIFLRGFDAREGQDIEFTVDGIPVNEVGAVPELLTENKAISIA
jgi:iron complex outermembrane receptor protein